MSEEQSTFLYQSTGEDEIDASVLRKQNALLQQENQKLRNGLDDHVQQSTSYIFKLQEENRQLHSYVGDMQPRSHYNEWLEQENKKLREDLDRNIAQNVGVVSDLRQENQRLKRDLAEKRGSIYLQLKDLEQENIWLQEELHHLKQKEDQKMGENPGKIRNRYRLSVNLVVTQPC